MTPDYCNFLEKWYRANQRNLPWRTRTTPYRVWVSEIMLQQTRVEVVIPYYRRFLRRFPSMTGLAKAPIEEVLEAWSGLGYYRRARMLHEGARHVVEQFGGRFPRDLKTAQAIPGIGRYTAGAILSIAYGERAPILDGNVLRVLARVFGIKDDVHSGAGRARIWELATRAVEAGDPSTINQAQMELGALICTPKNPRCGECPLSGICIARARGWVERIPRVRPRRAAVDVSCAVLLVRNGDRVLLRQRCDGELLPGLWDLQGTFLGNDGDRSHGLEIAKSIPHDIQIGARLGKVRHAVTYRRITLEIHEASSAQERTPIGWRWCTLDEAASMALSSPARKILAKWGEAARTSQETFAFANQT
jgi:A/G-specific adenine glycosylase